jgi:hypothetical protein
MADTRYQCSLQGAIIGSFYDKLLERLRGLCQPFETVYRIREVTLRTDASQGMIIYLINALRGVQIRMKNIINNNFLF